MSQRTIHNPSDRETVTFLVTGEESDGEFIRYEVRFAKGGSSAHEHRHPHQNQFIRVVRGRMGFSIDGAARIYEAGETLDIPPGTRHGQWNAGDDELVMVQEQRPAGRMEEFLRTVFGLVRDGRMNTFQAAVMLSEYEDCTRHVGWKALAMRAIAVVARRLGYTAHHAEYLADR